MADVEFEDNSVRVKNAIEEACIAWLHEVGGEIKSKASRNSPVDFGQLKGSWDYHVDKSKMEATVGSPIENAIWNEFGTGQHALKGDGRKTPWFVPVEGYTGTKKPTYQGKVIVVYGKNAKQYFKTDGKKPQRSLQKAFDSLKSKAPQALENKLKGLK